MGGELNAATSREHTVVYARVPDRHLEDALDVMADMVFAPTFADLDSEREVVLEEIAMVEDAPQDLVHDLLSEAVFSGHPLGRPVIGRADVISSIGRRAIAAYHRSAYVAGNIVLAAAGQPRARPRARACSSRRARQRVEPPGDEDEVRPTARPGSPRRASASSARTPSSSTSASARPGSPAPTAAASPPRCSTRSSAGRPRRGSSRRSARSAGWPTPSTASPRSTPTRA